MGVLRGVNFLYNLKKYFYECKGWLHSPNYALALTSEACTRAHQIYDVHSRSALT
jgi:hypothetical protein